MIIGKIALAPGRAGYYDHKTKIHLTIARPTSSVYDYMDTSNLKNSVRVGTIKLLFGCLDAPSEQPITPDIKEEIKQEEENKQEKEIKQEPKQTKDKKEDIVNNKKKDNIKTEKKKSNKTKKEEKKDNK